MSILFKKNIQKFRTGGAPIIPPEGSQERSTWDRLYKTGTTKQQQEMNAANTQHTEFASNYNNALKEIVPTVNPDNMYEDQIPVGKNIFDISETAKTLKDNSHFAAREGNWGTHAYQNRFNVDLPENDHHEVNDQFHSMGFVPGGTYSDNQYRAAFSKYGAPGVIGDPTIQKLSPVVRDDKAAYYKR